MVQQGIKIMIMASLVAGPVYAGFSDKLADWHKKLFCRTNAGIAHAQPKSDQENSVKPACTVHINEHRIVSSTWQAVGTNIGSGVVVGACCKLIKDTLSNMPQDGTLYRILLGAAALGGLASWKIHADMGNGHNCNSCLHLLTAIATCATVDLVFPHSATSETKS